MIFLTERCLSDEVTVSRGLYLNTFMIQYIRDDNTDMLFFKQIQGLLFLLLLRKEWIFILFSRNIRVNYRKILHDRRDSKPVE